MLAGHLRTEWWTGSCLPGAQRLSGQEWSDVPSVNQSHSQVVLTVLLQPEEEKECNSGPNVWQMMVWLMSPAIVWIHKSPFHLGVEYAAFSLPHNLEGWDFWSSSSGDENYQVLLWSSPASSPRGATTAWKSSFIVWSQPWHSAKALTVVGTKWVSSEWFCFCWVSGDPSGQTLNPCGLFYKGKVWLWGPLDIRTHFLGGSWVDQSPFIWDGLQAQFCSKTKDYLPVYYS